ncbi:Pex12 amino terminal region-domain-containing protein [Podospora conica]|nr:Pex12 amino terminal region-domain-containing protein [Schizothecium conicum]
MALSLSEKKPPPLTSSPYPYAAAPDIIRAHQKDAYFQGYLTNQLNDLHRRLRGARSAHAWATETRTLADLLYLSLTTLIGNRTLGEEYCDLVQVEEPTLLSRLHPPRDDAAAAAPKPGGPLLPSLPRRAGYIATSILLPYLFSRLLPSVRGALRRRLQDRLTRLTLQGAGSTSPTGPSRAYRLQRYLLLHLPTLTSGAHLHAAMLATFYFTGAYYTLSKRLLGLRYVFTRHVDPASPAGGRVGYEVLGVLLVVQMVVRSYLHVRDQLLHPQPTDDDDDDIDAQIRERAFGAGVHVSLDDNAYASNTELLPGTPTGSGNQRSLAEIGASTHTPVPRGGRPRYDLGAAGGGVMAWIKGGQQRKCTLCLEELRDPAATQCGHVFCWTCIGDWVREKPECPLCRRDALVQHILPLRAL